MNRVEVINETKGKIVELSAIKHVIALALKLEKVTNSEFNVILVDNEYIRNINKVYRGKDTETDVISFALEDTEDIALPYRMLGDIYISYEKAKSQALEYGHSLKREVCFLTVHGILHLLGYDHMNEKDERIMFSLQEMILDEASKTS